MANDVSSSGSNEDDRNQVRPTTIALVSGKGGSGKTLIATAFAQSLIHIGKRVLLVDADAGTGGLTYYLGFSAFVRKGDGLIEFLQEPSQIPAFSQPTLDLLENSTGYTNLSLLPIGKLADVEREKELKFDRQVLSDFINIVGDQFDYIIFDCRGGIDPQSISICGVCDKIVVVVETDAASIRASQMLSNTLGKNNLGSKVAGFILNKVMDNPASLANSGRSLFDANYLGAIPLDIETTRRFILGEMPYFNSIFNRHASNALFNLNTNEDGLKTSGLFRGEQFSTTSTRNPNATLGGGVVLGFSAYVFIVAIFISYSSLPTIDPVIPILVAATLFALTIIALSESSKSRIGAVANRYRNFILRIFRRV